MPNTTIRDTTLPDTDAPAFDCLFANIIGFMLPFFLTAAGGNPHIAQAAITDLIEAYNASTATELDLVGRIIGFSTAALDNLRLSMTQGLSDTKVLRYRCNAVTLSRASDQALKILEAVQAKREQSRKIPRPTVVAAPAPVPVQRRPDAAPPPNLPAAASPPMEIEAMKRDARIMMTAFSKQGGAAIPALTDPAVMAKAAAKAALNTSRGSTP